MAPVPEFESRLRILASPCYLLFSILLCLLHRLYYVIPDAFNHLLDRTAITPHQNIFYVHVRLAHRCNSMAGL